jgi:hypothetical protein
VTEDGAPNGLEKKVTANFPNDAMVAIVDDISGKKTVGKTSAAAVP